jgi:hypothetical protein
MLSSTKKQPLKDPPDDKQGSPVPVPSVSVVQLSRTVTMLFSLPKTNFIFAYTPPLHQQTPNLSTVRLLAIDFGWHIPL